MNETPRKKPFEGKRMPAWLGCPLFGILGVSMAWLAFCSIRDGMLSTLDSILFVLMAGVALLLSFLFAAGLYPPATHGTKKENTDTEANNTSEHIP